MTHYHYLAINILQSPKLSTLYACSSRQTDSVWHEAVKKMPHPSGAPWRRLHEIISGMMYRFHAFRMPMICSSENLVCINNPSRIINYIIQTYIWVGTISGGEGQNVSTTYYFAYISNHYLSLIITSQILP